MQQILFSNPFERLINEKRSNLLSPHSHLYVWLLFNRNKIICKYGSSVAEQRMDFHIELISNQEEATSELLLKRASELHQKNFSPTFSILGNAVVVFTPNVSRLFHTPYITIAYFPSGVPEDSIKLLNEEEKRYLSICTVI